MSIEIKPLAPSLMEDYFDFFDNRAFTDHAEWSFCYCTFFHMNKDLERSVEETVKADGGPDALRRALRDTARTFVEQGVISGYLAYADGVPVGWCNANAKASYSRLDYNPEVSETMRGEGDDRVKAITCFTIAPEYRGQGIAAALLNRAVRDARQEGYAAVEGYPRLHDHREPFDYYGPIRMFENAGFVRAAEMGQVVVMRKQFD